MSEKQQNATVHPTGDNLIVKRNDNTTPAGLTKVRSFDDPDEALQGTVAARGPGIVTLSGTTVDMFILNEDGNRASLEVGDGVIYRVKAAIEISIAGGKFDVVPFGHVVAVLKAKK